MYIHLYIQKAFDMPKKGGNFIVRIDVKLKKQLAEIALKSNKSSSEYVRRLIEDAIKRKKIL